MIRVSAGNATLELLRSPGIPAFDVEAQYEPIDAVTALAQVISASQLRITWEQQAEINDHLIAIQSVLNDVRYPKKETS